MRKPYRVAIVVVWAALFIAWTVALLRPIPQQVVHAVGGAQPSFWIAKTLHVSVYAGLSVLIAWLPFPRRWRLVLLAVLYLHGGATEFFQQWVPGRTASWWDVARDSLGTTIGVLLCCRRWRVGDDLRRETPQEEIKADRG
ncbi:MAG: VanZ family protein [Gemmataceae bacterium]